MGNLIISANTSWYIYNFRSSTIKALQKLGYKVICVSPEDNYTHFLVEELGCDWFDLKIDNKSISVISELITIFSIFYAYFKSKPSVVFNFTIKNNIYGTWAAKICGAKVFNNISGLGTVFIENGRSLAIVKSLYKLSLPLANKIFCQNPEDMQLLIDNKLINKDNSILLPGSGVNISRFSPTPDGRVLNLNKKFNFLYVGRILKDKGVLELIEAADILYKSGCRFQLLLCGFTDASNKTSLSESELLNYIVGKEYITWLGASDEIELVYAKADCVVLPSYREGMPRSLLEAGAMGIPSIASNVPGCKHIVQDGFNGFLCDAKSSKSLADKMKLMLGLSEAEYQKLATNSRNHIVENFDEDLVVSLTLSVLE